MPDGPKKHPRDSPKAALATVAVLAPVLALCCAGPALVASFLIGIGAWLDQRSPVEIVAAAAVGGLVGFGIVRWRRRRLRERIEGCSCVPTAGSEFPVQRTRATDEPRPHKDVFSTENSSLEPVSPTDRIS